ncbi:MAG: pyridoxal phosphate-dependent aminotransferase [Myxococcota bacterium]|nr:pyridoxal phosphate-dependent aminotransferase [Myxococcota bacterium]
MSNLRGSPYSKFAEHIKNMGTPTYPLHIGDTYLTPVKGACMEDLTEKQYPGMHRYTKTVGYPDLVREISECYCIDLDQILVTPGATGGLFLLAQTFVGMGEEVLILAPYWPLAAGIVQNVGGKPVSVPFYDRDLSVSDLLSPYLTDKTVAIYVNTPNNPTGLMLNEKQVTDLTTFARKNNLWIWADEVYEKLVFDDCHIEMKTYAPERTFSLYSFSKVFGMAGNRCGFILGPNAQTVRYLQKSAVNSFYSVSTASQIAALRALKMGESWLGYAREAYKQIAYETADILDLPRPQGSTFHFWDIKPYLQGRDMDDVFLRCIAAKLLIAPGSSFGAQYSTYVRFCYTCAPPGNRERGSDPLEGNLTRFLMSDGVRFGFLS